MILAIIFIQLVSMNFLKNSFLLLIILSLHAPQCKKENKNAEPPGAVEIKDTAIVSNLRLPWEILWGPDDHIWMTERNGKISRVNPSTGAITTITTIDEVVSIGEGGLLGMTLHPNFAALHYKCNETLFHYNSTASEAFCVPKPPLSAGLPPLGEAMPPTPISEVT